MYKTMQQIEEKKKKFLSYFLESETKESDQMEGERERKGWDKTTSQQVALSQVLHMSVLSYSPNGIVHVSGGAMPVC